MGNRPDGKQREVEMLPVDPASPASKRDCQLFPVSIWVFGPIFPHPRPWSFAPPDNSSWLSVVWIYPEESGSTRYGYPSRTEPVGFAVL